MRGVSLLHDVVRGAAILNDRRPSTSKEWRESILTHYSGSLHPHEESDSLCAFWRISRISASSTSTVDEEGLCIEGLLSQWPLLRSCCPGAAGVLAAIVLEQDFSPSQEIVQAGTETASLMFVVRGQVDILIGNVKVGTLATGQYFGEALVLGIEERWKVTLRAGHGFCTIGEVRQDDFWTVCRSSPAAAQWVEAVANLRKLNVHGGNLLPSFKLFQGLSENTIVALDDSMSSRLFFPGEILMQEGFRGDEMFILLYGRVTVELAGRVVRTHDRTDFKEPPSTQEVVCLGELGFLGLVPSRSATVTAQSVCLVRVLFRSVLLQLLQQHSDSMPLQNVQELVQGRQPGTPAKQTLHGVPMFREAGCSDAFLGFLAQHLEERVYLCDQTIVEKNTDDRCMYILSHGTAKVLNFSLVVNTLASGSVIGEMNLVGVVAKHSRTIVATEVCYVEVLHPSIVLQGLELFAEERPKVLAAACKSSGAGSGCSNVLSSTMDSELRRNLLQEVAKAPFFEGMSVEFVEQLSALSVDRIFLPGELIIEQGRKGDSMFILVSGEASIFLSQKGNMGGNGGELVDLSKGEPDLTWPAPEVKPFDIQNARKVTHLSVGSVFGELAMVGIAPTRMATVKTETFCSLWEICQAKVLQFMDEFPDFRKKFASAVSAHLELTVARRFQTLPLFKDFDQQFRTLLCLSCKRCVYFPGQTIAREGQRGQGLLLLNVGEAKFEYDCIFVATYLPGSHIGCEIMLGVQKAYVATLTATQACHVLVITRESYLTALQRYPLRASADALLEFVTRESDAFQLAMKRLRLKLFVMHRCTVAMSAALQSPEAPRGIYAGMLESELKSRTFRTWSSLTKGQVALRRQKESRRNKEQEWTARLLVARKHRLLQEHLALQTAERFDWVVNAKWDNSTVPTSARARQPALPRVAPISGISTRALSTPRVLPPIHR